MNETRIIRLEHGVQDLVTQDVGQQREHGHHLEEEEHSRRHCHYVRLGKIVQKILQPNNFLKNYFPHLHIRKNPKNELITSSMQSLVSGKLMKKTAPTTMYVSATSTYAMLKSRPWRQKMIRDVTTLLRCGCLEWPSRQPNQ